MGQKCWYLAQNASFGPNLAVLGPKILISMGVSKSFGTNITKKKHWTTCPHCFLVRHYLAQNASFGPNLAVFGPEIQFFWGQGVKILVPSYRDSNETPFSCWKHWSVRLQLAARGENVLFLPQNLDIWGQKSFFLFWNQEFCQQGISPVYQGLQLSNWDHPYALASTRDYL